MRAAQTTEAAAQRPERGPLPSGDTATRAPRAQPSVLPASLPPLSGMTGPCEFSGESFLLKLRPQEDTWPVSANPPGAVPSPRAEPARTFTGKRQKPKSAPPLRPRVPTPGDRHTDGRRSGSSDAASVPRDPASSPPTCGGTSHPRQLPRANPTNTPAGSLAACKQDGVRGTASTLPGAPRPHAGHAGGGRARQAVAESPSGVRGEDQLDALLHVPPSCPRAQARRVSLVLLEGIFYFP